MFFASLPLFVSAQVEKKAEEVVKSYLTKKNKDVTRDAFINYDITADLVEKNDGIRRIQAIQKSNGIYIKDAILSIALNKKGKTFTTNTFVDYRSKNASPSISGSEALKKAMKANKVKGNVDFNELERKSSTDKHMVYAKGNNFASNPESRLIYLKDDASKTLILAYETQIHTKDRQHYYVSYVNASTGEVLETEDKVLHCSFGPSLVYDASPAEQAILDQQKEALHLAGAEKWEKEYGHADHDHHYSALPSTVAAPANSYLVLDLPAEAPNDDSAENNQTVVTTAGDPIASPYGWTSIDGVTQNVYTKGNNVFAFYDPSPTPLGGIPNPAAAAMATSNNPLGAQAFHYAWDLSQEPDYIQTSTNNPTPNRNAAIVNLFYQNNLIHDIFYNFGFTEEGRNFQFENFGKGGEGRDELLAQAQDGGGTNNANMLTLQDGVSPQMQMYLWTSAGQDELVKINQVSGDGHVEEGDAFIAIQGALYSPVTPYNLHENPVLNKPFVLVNDGCGSSLGCGLGSGIGSAPCNNVVGMIVIIDRGDCSFVEKVDGAQRGGAAGAIIVNNNSSSPDEVAAMGGTDPTLNTITIPAVMVSYNTGLLIKETLAQGIEIIGSLEQDTPPQPKKDGDFDNGIIAHEYGHGISSRTSPQGLTGGTLSGDEQGGEGWSDFYALYLTTTSDDLGAVTSLHPNGTLPNKGIGTYVTYTDPNGTGIRPRKYSTDLNINEYTFAGTTNGGFGVGNSAEITIPHGIGFIWCTMLWEVAQNLVDEYGFNNAITYNPPSGDIAAIAANNAGNNLALKLIQEGIRLQKPSPTFLDMRDAILLADSLHYDGAHGCLIWKAFAKRGLGIDAINPTNNIGDERDGYATPCGPAQAFHDIEITAPSLLENDSDLSYTIKVTNTSGIESENIVVTDAIPNNFSISSVEGATYVQNGRMLTFTIASIPADGFVELTVNGYVLTENTSNIVVQYSFEAGEEGWLAVTGGGNTFERRDDGDAQDGNAYFYTTNAGLTGANTTLESPELPSSNNQRQIRFWHKFNTDSGYDGGFLETTTDGITWTRLALQENGYNGVLSSLYNPVSTGAAFTGSFAEYTESAGLLPAGTTKVRFVFSEDVGSGGGDGWWIDNIKIVENPVVLGSAVTATDPISSGGRVYVDETFTLILPSTKAPFDVKPSLSIVPGVVNESSTPMRVLVDVIEMSGNETSGPIKVRISKNDYLGFDFDPSLTVVGGVAVDNSSWTYSENFLFWEFTSFAKIDELGSTKFGFTGTFNASGQGDVSITAKTSCVSPLETNSSNDRDSETINYSIGNNND
ncbi:hypothetical protein GCM10007940_27860 [Portibacter lacus]|uniref:DUF11 domain-containing protein n=2 Tax=Portibacter lacus TaxID=1099794 RepID=A0AA37ST33_9BACT|nr:hypothetical protein GCM10007940_27860 [Portibacter lacus]